MKITIDVIPHHDQRYNTVGDWQFDNNNLSIKVSKLGDSRLHFLVGIHELIEVVLCTHNGISSKQVDSFDFNYNGIYEEPGNDPKAPYYKEHQIATFVEAALAQELDVNWEVYGATVKAVTEKE